LRGLDFTGTVLVPERQDWSAKFNYFDQVEWEYAGLESCSVIAFWVPRELQTLPGFTTNVKFGRYVGSGRCVYGRPDRAPPHSILGLALHEDDRQAAREHGGGNASGGRGDGGGRDREQEGCQAARAHCMEGR
jgi:hypothetical protein